LQQGDDGAIHVHEWQDPGAGSKKQSLLDLTRPVAYGDSESQITAVVNASIMARSWGRGSTAFNKPIVVDLVLPMPSKEEPSSNALAI